jgi:hypothetical protein
MEIKCLECGKPVPQTPGKRKKEYCNSTCRTTLWKKKKNAGKEKRGPGRPKKNAEAKTKPVTPPETKNKPEVKPKEDTAGKSPSSSYMTERFQLKMGIKKKGKK